MSKPIGDSGCNPEYGLLGSNKSTEEKLKLFPKTGDVLVICSLNTRPLLVYITAASSKATLLAPINFCYNFSISLSCVIVQPLVVGLK